jgi:hypothetical protein
VSWIQLTESRFVQQSFVNKVMHLQVPYKVLFRSIYFLRLDTTIVHNSR